MEHGVSHFSGPVNFPGKFQDELSILEEIPIGVDFSENMFQELKKGILNEIENFGHLGEKDNAKEFSKNLDHFAFYLNTLEITTINSESKDPILAFCLET